MDRKYLQSIAIVALVFFSWTFGGLFDVAYAIKDSGQVSGARDQQTKGNGQKANNGSHQTKDSGQQSAFSNQQTDKKQKTEEKLQRAIEEIVQIVDKVKTVQTDQERENEKKKLKAKKTEIEAHDIDIRKEFAETEKKLKGSKLPDEILQRHYKFVKNYEDNLTELKANLNDIDKAKGKAEVEAKAEKTRKHLEKVKPPKRHQPLDPNKLPHRSPEVKKREPRLKYDSDQLSAISFQPKTNPQSLRPKPVLLAANGPITGLFDSPIPNTQPPTPVLLAAAVLPSSADLAQTIEVQFTPEIQAKATELNNNPVKIYNWVRNNIEYVPTYGSIQGANMCLQTKQCNAFDTSSLLIALLRASNIPAKYVYGTIELPIEKVMNWAGGFTDAKTAVNFIASGGVPVKGFMSGGKVSKIQMEHIWVKAFVDYIPSFGAVHKQGDTWIPLDPSFKQYTYADGLDFQTLVPLDGQSLADQIAATSTVNEQESYATNISSSLIQTALSDYNTSLENYVNTNNPNATVDDILGKKEIIKKEQPILPASLPYKVIVAGAETNEISDQYRHKVAIQLVNVDFFGDIAFTYSISLPQLAGKRFTISYDPATQADQDTINKYVSEYATSIPVYLIQLKPVLRLENTIVALGVPIGMGNGQNLNITLNSPYHSEIVTHNLLAGDYGDIGINPSTISLEVLQSRIDKSDFSEPVGEMLHQTALSYWAQVDAFNKVISNTYRVVSLRHPSELLVTAKIGVSYVYGAPSSAAYKTRTLDVKFDHQSMASVVGDKTRGVEYLKQSGAMTSFMEGAIFDQLFGRDIGDGATAITLLKLANEQGIPIYKIDAINIAATLPNLQVSDAIKDEIANSVNAGLTVQISKTNVTHNGWTGAGYIILNPLDGSGAYRISGGLNGGESNTDMSTVYPMPQIPATGISAFIVGSIAKNTGVALRVVGERIVGLEWGKIASSAGIAGAIVLLLLMAKAISDIYVRNRPPDDWVTLRHYTNLIDYLSIRLSLELRSSDPRGVFLTDLVLVPMLPRDSRIPSQLPVNGLLSDILKNSDYVKLALELPEYNSAETFIELRINRAALGGQPKVYKACALQYVTPCNEWLFPQRIMVIGVPGIVEILSP